MAELIILIAAGGGLLGLMIRLLRRSYEVGKRVLDIMLGIVALLLSLPVLAVCAAVIRLSSRGPVLFTQVRSGKDGKPFRMFKLRTMHDGAEADTGAVWASDEDPRVIRSCRWMRRSHVDELPQLINVIFGQMSLVGPRPERPEIMADLEQHYHNAPMRLAVAPGITGLAQIRWGYDTTPERFRRKLESDLEYIRNRSLGTDLRILLATLPKFVDHQSR